LGGDAIRPYRHDRDPSAAARFLEISQKSVGELNKAGRLRGIPTPLGISYPIAELERVKAEREAA
jgi:hypothetical protein